MGLRRIDANETDEQRDTREEQERIVEKERQDRETELSEKVRAEELRAAKAEAALEEARRRPVESVNTGPTETQWQDLERQNPGKTRSEIQDEFNRVAMIADARVQPLNARAAAAEERARAAEERVSRIEGRRSLDKVEDSFYKKNPALEQHRKDVDEFLAEFPDNDKIDSKTYEKRLGLASDFVKGRVKNMRSESRRGEFSSRQVESGDDEDRYDDRMSRFDPKGTGGNRGAISLMETVMDDYGRNTRHEDSVEYVKKCEDDEGRGVSISSEEDVAHARRLVSRGVNLGGKRGEK